jgi:hypothetical protein
VFRRCFFLHFVAGSDSDKLAHLMGILSIIQRVGELIADDKSSTRGIPDVKSANGTVTLATIPYLF